MVKEIADRELLFRSLPRERHHQMSCRGRVVNCPLSLSLDIVLSEDAGFSHRVPRHNHSNVGTRADA